MLIRKTEIVKLKWVESCEIVDEVDDIEAWHAMNSQLDELSAVDEFEDPFCWSWHVEYAKILQLDAFVFRMCDVCSWIFMLTNVHESQLMQEFTMCKKLEDLIFESAWNVTQMKDFDMLGNVDEIVEELQYMSIIFSWLTELQTNVDIAIVSCDGTVDVAWGFCRWQQHKSDGVQEL